MRPFITTPIAAVFVCFLALIFPSRTMAKVTHETAKCADADIKQLPNGAWGCVVPLKVRPPSHGGGSNPSDWGMCGVLGISANFGPPTVARIIVDASGYYSVELEGNLPGVVPTLDVTCVLFSDFQGVPSVSEATFFTPPHFKHGKAFGTENIKGSAGKACIWAGLFGDLETLNMNIAGGTDGAFGAAFAQFDKSETVFGAQNVATYAFCNGYTSASWKGWTYLNPSGGVSAPRPVIKLAGLDDAHDWCYMDRIEAHLLIPPESRGLISATLDLSGGNYNSLAVNPSGGVWVSFNCLPLKQ